jgi:hypothetical protein
MGGNMFRRILSLIMAAMFLAVDRTGAQPNVDDLAVWRKTLIGKSIVELAAALHDKSFTALATYRFPHAVPGYQFVI